MKMPSDKIILALTAVSAGLPSALTFEFYTKEKPGYLTRALLSSAFVVLTVAGAVSDNDLLMYAGIAGIAALYVWSIWRAFK